jgi:hypothetical protein
MDLEQAIWMGLQLGMCEPEENTDLRTFQNDFIEKLGFKGRKIRRTLRNATSYSKMAGRFRKSTDFKTIELRVKADPLGYAELLISPIRRKIKNLTNEAVLRAFATDEFLSWQKAEVQKHQDAIDAFNALIQ